MSFGCHNCGVDLTKYANWLDSPCATCRLGNDSPTTKRPALFDTAKTCAPDGEESSYLARVDKALEAAGDDPPPPPDFDKLTPDMLQTLRKIIEEQIYSVLAGTIVKLLKLGKTSPVMLELVLKKMQYPLMSYSELGASMKEPFSKQNVLYHLKHAVDLMPELSSVLLTDTRFSGGRYALKTIANKRRQEEACRRIRGLLYGDQNPDMQAKDIKELNSILHAPFMITDEAVNFDAYNAYVKDEE